jgi:hypothetical protein
MTIRRTSSFLFTAILFCAAVASAQVWQPLNHAANFSAGTALLLTDGTVLVHSEQSSSSQWYKLTPDANGSYVNGTWSQIAPMPAGYAPLYFASAVLPDGRMLVEGGEYNNLSAVWTNLGAIYDPLANSWISVAPPSGWTTIGDAQSAVLSNGTFMLANCCTKETALFNATSLTWTPTGTGKFDVNDEEGWNLLPSGKILTVDAYVFQYDAGGTNSELYDPNSGAWSSAGSTIVQLWDSAAACGGAKNATFEVGPAVLRPDRTVFYTGSNGCAAGHTAVYNSQTGTWTAGPDFPGTFNVADGPAALEPNGQVIVMSSRNTFSPPHSKFFEWNGSGLTEVPGPPNASHDASFVGHFLELPTGQLLFTDFSTDVEVFTPGGTYDAMWAPAISKAPTSVVRGHSYAISGTQFNGLSQGAAYGDDAQNATNYPLVRLVNNATGHVFYCRTHDHSSMAVATGNQVVSTQFDVPANTETGPAQVFVVANGIPSAPSPVTVH